MLTTVPGQGLAWKSSLLQTQFKSQNSHENLGAQEAERGGSDSWGRLIYPNEFWAMGPACLKVNSISEDAAESCSLA